MGEEQKEMGTRTCEGNRRNTAFSSPFHPSSPALTHFSAMALFLRPVLFPGLGLSSRAMGSTAASLHLTSDPPTPQKASAGCPFGLCSLSLAFPRPHPLPRLGRLRSHTRGRQCTCRVGTAWLLSPFWLTAQSFS